MSYQVKDLIERLSKMPPDTLLWSSWASKEDVNDYFVEGCEISDDDFTAFIESFQGDWEYAAETISDCVDVKFYCSVCALFDYNAKEIADETICSQCGEEKDLLTT
jgi:hypothetical protein